MAQIDLHIHADSPEDLHQAIAGLNRTPAENSREVLCPAAPFVQPDYAEGLEAQQNSEAVNDLPVRNKGGRPRKDAAGPQPEAPAESAVAELAKTEALPASTALEPSASDVTIEQVRSVLQKYMSTDGKSMLGAQNIMKADFTQADGTPVQQLTKLQPKDYAAYIAALNADLGV